MPRKDPKNVFSDRNVDDVKDGHVSCESYSEEKPFEHVSTMDRGVQAVPTVAEGESQTELKHPKNVSIQYEARIFGPAEVEEIWNSEEMITFLNRAEKM